MNKKVLFLTALFIGAISYSFSQDTITVNISDTLEVSSVLDGSVVAVPHGFGVGESFTLHIPQVLNGSLVDLNTVGVTNGTSGSTSTTGERNSPIDMPGWITVSGSYEDGSGTFSYTFEVVSQPVVPQETILVPEGGAYTVSFPADYPDKFEFIVWQKWDGTDWVWQETGFSKDFSDQDAGFWRIGGAAIQDDGLIGYDYFTVQVESTGTVYDVTFSVTETVTANPVTGAVVNIAGEGTQNTDGSGLAVFTELEDGTYSYEVTASGYVTQTGSVTVNGENVTENVSMAVITAVGELAETDISVYPNPCTSYIRVSQSGVYEIWRLSNSSAEQMYEIQIEADGEINVSDLSPGMYLITVSNAKGKKAFKFIKN